MTLYDEKKVPDLTSFYNNDEKKRDQYVRELENAIQKYIKTGVKSKQLDEVWEVEQVFQIRYQERFDVQKLITKTLKEEVKKELGNEQRLTQRGNTDTTQRSTEVEEAVNSVLAVMEKTLSNELPKIIRDAAYLGHINLIYEMYKKEEKLRQEEEEFVKISKQYQRMADIASKLSQERRMKIEELQKSVNLPNHELTDIIEKNRTYFNIRPKEKTLQISLSPIGRKYNTFSENTDEKYTRETLNRLVFKNCNALIEAFSKSYDGRSERIETQLKLDAVSSGTERTIKHKYHEVVQKFSKDNEGHYTWDTLMNMQERGKQNERNSYTILRARDAEIDKII